MTERLLEQKSFLTFVHESIRLPLRLMITPALHDDLRAFSSETHRVI